MPKKPKAGKPESEKAGTTTPSTPSKISAGLERPGAETTSPECGSGEANTAPHDESPPAGSARNNQGAGNSSPKWQRRTYQTTALVASRQTRILGLFWARQCRKSTTLGDIAFDVMSQAPGKHVIAASASLLLGTELVSKTVTAAEQAAIVGREAAALQAALIMSSAARAQALQLVAADSDTGKVYAELSGEAFAELYQSGRLEMRLHFDRTAYSRLRVIAPNPATARGWTGTVLRDEVGFVKNEAAVQEAVKPIIDTDPSFRMVYSSNLPDDDRHPWFEMTLPRDPSLTFAPNGRGHFYRGQTGLRVHRVSIADAYAAGHKLYNDDGQAMTLEEAARNETNRGAWRRNYELVHQFGGAAVIDALALHTSQQRGIGHCALIYVDSDIDFDRGLRFLSDHLGDGTVGLGFDVATTTRLLSNPSSLTVTESRGVEKIQRAVFVWKERHPQIARDRLRRVIDTIGARPSGGPARRLCLDSSNERYFAEETGDLLRAVVPVELVNASTAVHPPGYDEPTNMKTWLGDLYSTEFNDNHYAAPPEAYYKEDHRLVVKERGLYQAEPDPKDGKHADTFDSGKLAQHALVSAGNFWSALS